MEVLENERGLFIELVNLNLWNKINLIEKYFENYKIQVFNFIDDYDSLYWEIKFESTDFVLNIDLDLGVMIFTKLKIENLKPKLIKLAEIINKW